MKCNSRPIRVQPVLHQDISLVIIDHAHIRQYDRFPARHFEVLLCMIFLSQYKKEGQCGRISTGTALTFTFCIVTSEDHDMYKIFVVEDDAVIARAVVEHITSWGWCTPRPIRVQPILHQDISLVIVDHAHIRQYDRFPARHFKVLLRNTTSFLGSCNPPARGKCSGSSAVSWRTIRCR